jgi:hypothetical protein
MHSVYISLTHIHSHVYGLADQVIRSIGLLRRKSMWALLPLTAWMTKDDASSIGLLGRTFRM